MYEGGAEFAIQRIDMVGNTGTYLDSPFHRFPDGDDLAGLALQRLAHLEAVVVMTATPWRSLPRRSRTSTFAVAEQPRARGAPIPD